MRIEAIAITYDEDEAKTLLDIVNHPACTKATKDLIAKVCEDPFQTAGVLGSLAELYRLEDLLNLSKGCPVCRRE